MQYVILYWNESTLEWSIASWSHTYKDAKDQYERLKGKYKRVRLMLDERITPYHLELKKHEMDN